LIVFFGLFLAKSFHTSCAASITAKCKKATISQRGDCICSNESSDVEKNIICCWACRSGCERLVIFSLTPVAI